MDDDADMKDGSFTEAAASGTGKQSLNTTTGKTSDIIRILPFTYISLHKIVIINVISLAPFTEIEFTKCFT